MPLVESTHNGFQEKTNKNIKSSNNYYELITHITSNMDLQITWAQGGMMEHMKTGNYRQVLEFHSEEEKISMERVYRGGFKTGLIKNKKGKALYRYQVKDEDCKVIRIENGNEVGEWIDVPLMIMMCD